MNSTKCDKKEEIKEQEEFKYGNKTVILNFIIGFQLIACIIGAIILWNIGEIGFGFIVFVGGIIISALIQGFTDIIDLLDSINNKLNSYIK